MVAREQAELVDIAGPGTLGANQVRGRTLCSLVSPGTELAWNYTGASFQSFPGYAATFEVEDVGGDVTGVSAGDLCFCMGSHRSFQQLVFHKYVILRSGWEWELPPHANDFSPQSIHKGFDTALQWLAGGRIRTEGLMAAVAPREAQRVYQDLLHRRAPTADEAAKLQPPPVLERAVVSTWQILPRFRDTIHWTPSESPTPNVTDWWFITVADGLPDGRHELTLVPLGDGPVAVRGVEVHRPPPAEPSGL